MTKAMAQIRQALAVDLPRIVELSYGLFQEDAGRRDPWTNVNWPLEHGHKYFADHLSRDSSICFLAEVNDAVIGYLIGYVYGPSTLRPIKCAELESMFVAEAYRSQGAGGQLVEQFTSWARDAGAERMSVTAYYANIDAVRFYQERGFVPKNIALEMALV